MPDERDVVKAQYENWVYPEPIADLAADIAGGYHDYGDPALVRRKLWPRKVEPAALEILVAGCGTHQGAHYAFTNPESHVVGIDISDASLDHERLLKDKHQLSNLELRQLPVENAAELNQPFDLIVSTGVLHHLPDPDSGLRSLRDVLAPHGVMSLMLYGHYGRLGVYMMQETLRLLGAEQDADGLELTQHLLELDALGAAILDRVNGATPVRQILEETSPVGAQAGWTADEHAAAARRFFQRMAEWDHFLFEIP